VREAPGQTRDCPKCQGVGRLTVPEKFAEQAFPVFGCTACGFAFKADGTAFLENTSELRDFFRGATLGNDALTKGLSGVGLPPAAMALLQTQVLEYGTAMWFDGLKQGILLGAIQAHHKDKKNGHG
jgi:hypothetical protein